MWSLACRHEHQGGPEEERVRQQVTPQLVLVLTQRRIACTVGLCATEAADTALPRLATANRSVAEQRRALVLCSACM
jgi:hypothetical protein